jgi:hypothetical protein
VPLVPIDDAARLRHQCRLGRGQQGAGGPRIHQLAAEIGHQLIRWSRSRKARRFAINAQEDGQRIMRHI